MKFINIASGSKGNASIIFTENTKICIDFGITKKRANEVLSKYGFKIDDVDYYFFTHNHSDHVLNSKYLEKSKCFAIPMILENQTTSPLKIGETYVFGDIELTIIKTSHDAPNSCGFIISCKGRKIGYITDTGKLNERELIKLQNLDYYYFESNYDREMLETSGRPQYLISRIKSNKGHLSNNKSAKYLLKLIGEKTKVVCLAHLSEECNSIEKAMNTHESIWHKEHRNIKLICAKQYEATEIC